MGMSVSDAKRLNELETENTVKRTVRQETFPLMKASGETQRHPPEAGVGPLTFVNPQARVCEDAQRSTCSAAIPCERRRGPTARAIRCVRCGRSPAAAGNTGSRRAPSIEPDEVG